MKISIDLIHVVIVFSLLALASYKPERDDQIIWVFTLWGLSCAFSLVIEIILAFRRYIWRKLFSQKQESE